MPDSRLSELYLEALTNSGTPSAVTLPQDSRLSELYLEALTNAGSPTAVTLAQNSQLSEVYVEALTDSGPLVIAFADSGTSAGADYPSALVADGASAYYPLDETTGGYDFRDTIAGYGVDYPNGVTPNQPPATAKLGGRSIRLGNNDYLRLQGRYLNGFGSAFMAGWVKCLSSETGFSAIVFRLTYNQYWFNIELNNGSPVFYAFFNGPGSQQMSVSGLDLRDDQWHFLAISFDASTGNFAGYVDGVRRTLTNVGTSAQLPQGFSYYPQLGGGQFGGYVDDFAYSAGHALTDAQVAELYRAGTTYAEALQIAVDSYESDAATATDSFVGGPVYQVSDTSATGTESLRVLIVAAPGPKNEVSPDAADSANLVELHYVRDGHLAYVQPDDVDSASSVRVTISGPTAVDLDPCDSASSVNASFYGVINLGSYTLECDSADRVAISVSTLDTGSGDGPPNSLQVQPDSGVAVSYNPAVRLLFHSQALLSVVADGVPPDPGFDPLAGVDPSVLDDQQEAW